MAVGNKYQLHTLSRSQYDSLPKSSDYLYFVSESDGRISLYKGDVLVSNSFFIVSSLPSSGTLGKLYLNTGDGLVYYYSGSAWVKLAREVITSGLSGESTNDTVPSSKLVWDTISSFISTAQDAQASAEAARDAAISAKADAEAAMGNAESARDAAVSAKTAAEAARGDAQTASAEAEAARGAAISAKTDAEAARDDALSAKVEAEAARNDAMSAKADAEAARGDAQTASAEAKSARDAAISAKVDAEIARSDAESARSDAWAAKVEAESARDGAVASQAGVHEAQTAAEAARDAALSAKDDAEIAKADAEAVRSYVESARDAAISAKADAEAARGEAESARDAVLSAKTDAEAARDAAVSAKADAETAKAEAESAKDYAQTASGQAESARDDAVSAKADAEVARGDAQTLRDQTEAIYESVRATVSTYYVGPAYNYGVTVDGTMLSFTWTDPADNNVVKWARTRLVMKTGGFPADENDGTVLIDVTERNQHKTVPFTWDAGVISGYYFALFTQTTGGVWNTGDDCPRFTTDELTWATIAMMSRAGTLLQYPDMKIGGVVDIKVNDMYPKLRYRLADIDYSGSFAKVSDFMYDNTRTHNSIWIPYFLPSLGDGNSTATMMQFDAPESSYGATWDDVFITGKAYYTVSGESYTQLTAGTDYQDGENVSDWQTLHGDIVYSKNHADRVKWGNNIWKESNMRQWLNSTGNDWFQKQNEYDVRSGSTGYSSGWLTGFVTGFLDLVMPVNNKTARNTVSAVAGGGGGGYDITLDRFWLLSIKEVFGNNNNGIAEGQQLLYFRDVATTNNQRIQYDEGGVARNVWLRSHHANSANHECHISSSGVSNANSASSAFAFQPAMCI